MQNPLAMPMAHATTPHSASRSSPNPPTGNSTGLSPRQGALWKSPCPIHGQGMFRRSGSWDSHTIATPLARPTPRQKSKSVDNAAKHGERVRQYAIASQLLGRLDTDDPAEHQGPEEGFGGEVIELDKRGSERVRVGMEESTVRAYDSGGSKVRTRTSHGGLSTICMKNTMWIFGTIL